MPHTNGFFNNGQHIARILKETVCNKHSAPEGMPCYEIPSGSNIGAAVQIGVCGGRIKRAGYNGKVTPTSMQLKRSSR